VCRVAEIWSQTIFAGWGVRPRAVLDTKDLVSETVPHLGPRDFLAWNQFEWTRGQMIAAQLGPLQRQRALRRMRDETFDIVVVGGGVTGAGIALDAATRGLSVALLEKRDWAAGTSSRSGKLIHGGVRYLEQLNFGLVREALRERALMLTKLAPHLVRPIRFLYPLQHRVLERPYVGAGLLLYDTIGGAGAVPRHRHLSKRAARTLAPALREDALTGALTFYDAQVDDSRHTLTLVRTAATYGAVVASAAKVVAFRRDGERITGVRVRDVEDGGEFDVWARHVINATGVWTDETQELVGGRGKFQVRASKGVHILVPKDRIDSETSLLVRAEDSVLIVRSWGNQWLIGTTDTDWNLDLDHPAANANDIEYLLRNVNRLIDPPLGHDDVQGVYAGLRPLLAGESDATSRLSREHAVASPMPGLTVIAGGKYTTYRVMAKDAVDEAVRDLGGTVPASGTEDVPLVGAEGYHSLWNSRQRLATETGLDVSTIEHLLHRYGSLIDELLAVVQQHPDLAQPLEGTNYLRVEARYAASHEGALHLEDVLTRRTHLSFETHDRGLHAAERIADVMGDVLGWDAGGKVAEVEMYRRRVEAERESQLQPDDASADAVRRVIRDPRLIAGA
jgi:glycerol-3-phosphate dehydrogenase